MISFDDKVVEEMLEKPYWIVDILPKQVPKDSTGQYAAVEQYYLQKPLITELRKKDLAILFKLNCYYDIVVSIDGGDHWHENPEIQKLEKWLTTDINTRTVHVLFPDHNTMMVMDCDDTYLTIYNPTGDFLQMLRMIAGSEGLFAWKPEEQV